MVNIFKNLIIDILGERNNNILQRATDIGYDVQCKELNEVTIISLDNRLGDSIFILALAYEIRDINENIKICILHYSNNIAYSFISKYGVKLINIGDIRKNIISKLIEVFSAKKKIYKDISLNLDSGINVLHFFIIKICNIKYNIGFNKDIFRAINLSLQDPSIKDSFDHNINKINIMMYKITKNKSYLGYRLKDYKISSEISNLFNIHKKNLIYLNTASSDPSRSTSAIETLSIVNHLLSLNFEVLHRGDISQKIKNLGEKYTFINTYETFEELIESLSVIKFLITVDTSFTHIA